VPIDALNFAVEGGTGRYECATVGLDVSKGGALRTLLGMLDTGGVLSTSFCSTFCKSELHELAGL
jgi:hypothetical protein